MSVLEFALPDVAATEALGARLAQILPRVHLIYLRGPLGAGKTTVVRGMLRSLGHTGTVKSPTFTLVEPYALNDGSLYHFDFYRINDPEELEFLGLRDYLAAPGVCVIEWPERGGALLPAPDLDVTMRIMDNGRSASVRAATSAGAAALNEF